MATRRPLGPPEFAGLIVPVQAAAFLARGFFAAGVAATSAAAGAAFLVVDTAV